MALLTYIINYDLIFFNIYFLIAILIRMIGFTLRYLQPIISFFFTETTCDLMYGPDRHLFLQPFGFLILSLTTLLLINIQQHHTLSMLKRAYFGWLLIEFILSIRHHGLFGDNFRSLLWRHSSIIRNILWLLFVLRKIVEQKVGLVKCLLRLLVAYTLDGVVKIQKTGRLYLILGCIEWKDLIVKAVQW